jgi:hypothetical protein
MYDHILEAHVFCIVKGININLLEVPKAVAIASRIPRRNA